MKLSRFSIEARTALLFLLFSNAWILFSDRMLAAVVTDPAQLTAVQTCKGWGFVAASALLIYSLLRRYLAVQRLSDLALLANEERYRLLFNTSLDAILITAPDGSIFAANAAACRAFDRSEAEICQLGRSGLLDPADPRVRPALERRARIGHFSGELTFMRKDGSRFPGEISTAMFRDQEGCHRSSMIIRDITDA